MALSNGSRGVLLWIASGLAVATAGLFMFLLTALSGDVSENRQAGQDHAERISGIESQLPAIRGDLRRIDQKLDRLLDRRPK